ncbi:hypothetical protein M8C21_008553, partial [Ambrosia artemisiifolia]
MLSHLTTTLSHTPTTTFYRRIHPIPSPKLFNHHHHKPPSFSTNVSMDSITNHLNKHTLNQDNHTNLKLEDLNWDHSFIRDLPSDPRTDIIPRQVFHACYSKVSPSVQVDNPKLVAWSESVAEILDLDPK